MTTDSNKPLESELALRDLTDALDALRAEHSSPVKVRREFITFLNAAKRLPDIMEKDFKSVTGAKKSYREFWNSGPFTRCCRGLRNANEHDGILRLTAEERFRSSLEEFLGPAAPKGRKLTALVEGQKLGPFDEDLSPGIVFYHSNPETGKIDLSRPIGRTRETRFQIEPTCDRIKKALAYSPTRDVHNLSESCYSALKRLFENHKKELARHEEENR